MLESKTRAEMLDVNFRETAGNTHVDPIWSLCGNKLFITIVVALFVFGARLCVIKQFGVQEPYMDSFSEVHDYKAALAGDFRKVWENSVQLHNEHRILLTRWSNVAMLLLNGGKWDLLAQACFNAFLASLCVVATLATLGRSLRGIPFLALASVVTLCFGLPMAYENILWGFQSQHFFFILFSVVAIGLMPTSKVLSVAWWCGLASSILACVSVGSGFYASLAVAATCGVIAIRKEHRSASLFITFFVAVTVVIANVPFLVHVHSDESAKAHSVIRFFYSLLCNLSWPNSTAFEIWLIPVIWCPFVLWTAAMLWRKEPLPRSSYTIFGLGVWVLLIVLTISYLRGAYAPYIRYFDYNCFQVIVNAAAFLEIWRLRLYKSLPGSSKVGGAVVWAVVVLIGCFQLTDFAWFHGLPKRNIELKTEREAIREFYATGNENLLQSQNLEDIFPFTARYAHFTALVLADPRVSAFLPEDMKPLAAPQDESGILSRVRRVLLSSCDAFILVIAGAFLLLVVRQTALFLRTERGRAIWRETRRLVP